MATGRSRAIKRLLLCALLLLGCLIWCFTGCDKSESARLERGAQNSQDETSARVAEGPGPQGGSSNASDTEPDLKDGTVVREPAFLMAQDCLVAVRTSAWGSSATWELEGDVATSAALLLEDYEGLGTFRLAYDGYLDLLQRVWGCVVIEETGAVELALIDGRRDSDVFGEEDDGQSGCTLTLVQLHQR